MQHAEYEVDLDATEATLNVIEEQLESGSPIMQAEGALKVSAQHISATHSTPESSPRVAAASVCAPCCSFDICQETISYTRQRRGLDFCQLWWHCWKLPQGISQDLQYLAGMHEANSKQVLKCFQL